MPTGFVGRMTNLDVPPSQDDIGGYLGRDAAGRLLRLESFLRDGYEYDRELKFPFGASYGWGYRYSRKKQVICYVFFERGRFTVTLSIGKAGLAKMNQIFPELLPKTRNLWENRYPCGEGGWIHYQVLSDAELADVEKLICVKIRPKIGSR